MKLVTLAAIAVLPVLGTHAQMKPGVFASAAVGIHASKQTIISAGIHANVNRLYTGVNASPSVDGTVLYEARIGAILGKSATAVPYIGYGVRTTAQAFVENESKTAPAPASNGLGYGMLLTAPTAWDNTRLMLSFQFFDGQPAVAAGFKVPLLKAAACK